MPTIEVKNTLGEKVGEIDLDEAVFGADVNEHLLWEVVKWQRAKRRAGTHSTRNMSEVRGGGRKPYRQKGTGRARQGSTRSHVMVGGGKAFGPKPRDYFYPIPKKVRKGALRSALSLRFKENALVVLDEFKVEPAKTKIVVSALKSLGAENALVVDSKDNEGLRRGAGNLADAKWIAPEGLNVYDILDHKSLVVTSDSVKRIEAVLKPQR
ncbi:MAG: 50S ribosomal protein L4 [Pseudomonadota bacterium]